MAEQWMQQHDLLLYRWVSQERGLLRCLMPVVLLCKRLMSAERGFQVPCLHLPIWLQVHLLWEAGKPS